MEAAVGPWGAVLINCGVILSLLGAMLGYTVLTSEVPFEAARLGVFTKSFAVTNKKGAPVRTLVISALVVEAFFVLMVLSEGTYQFFYVLSLGLILIPYFLSSLFFLKLSVTSQDLFKGKLSGPVAKWVVCGIVGVAFSLFLVYATGIEYVVLMSLLFLPGVVVYAIGKRQRNQPCFQLLRDKLILAFIIVLAVVSALLLATGTVVL